MLECLAIVLGPLAEPAMRQSLIMSHGSIDIFFVRPIAGTIMVIAILLFLWPLIVKLRQSFISISRKPKM